jgi:hypothetical protein
MFYVKEHRLGRESVLAVCDREILGGTFEEGELAVTVSEGFYGGDLASAEEVAAKMREAENINIMGERAVQLAIEKKLVDASCVKKIGGVTHAIKMVV